MIEEAQIESKNKDIQLMKVIHDLKNPIMAIKQIVNNEDVELAMDLIFETNVNSKNNSINQDSIQPTKFIDNLDMEENYISNNKSDNIQNESINLGIRQLKPETKSRRNSKSSRRIGKKIINRDSVKIEPNATEHIQNIKNQVNTELEDIEEMIENLKTQFKSKNHMKFKEETMEVNSFQFIESFKNTHMKLAESGKNLLILTINKGFPKIFEIQKSLVKRILNNFASNSLKHTKNGTVNIIYKLIPKESLDQQNEYYQLGSKLEESDYYLCFEVQDNGSGIPPEKMNQIFSEHESDQSGQNWDGCGLGLPICEKLAFAINGRIFYQSTLDTLTTFSLIFNQESFKNNNNQKYDKYKNADNQIKNSLEFYIDYRLDQNTIISQHNHKCNSIIIAEDNKNILNRQVKQLDNKNIPYVTFMNGSDCLSYILDEIQQNCKQCTKKLILTDMHMPQMNGQELAVEILKLDEHKDIKLILLTADEPTIEFKSLNLFDEILVKPIPMKNFKNYQSQLKDHNEIHLKDNSKKIKKVKSFSNSTNFELQIPPYKEKLINKLNKKTYNFSYELF